MSVKMATVLSCMPYGSGFYVKLRIGKTEQVISSERKLSVGDGVSLEKRDNVWVIV